MTKIIVVLLSLLPVLYGQQVIPAVPCAVGSPQTGWQYGLCLPVIIAAPAATPAAQTPAPTTPARPPVPRPRPAPALTTDDVRRVVKEELAVRPIGLPSAYVDQRIETALAPLRREAQAAGAKAAELGTRITGAESRANEALEAAQAAARAEEELRLRLQDTRVPRRGPVGLLGFQRPLIK